MGFSQLLNCPEGKRSSGRYPAARRVEGERPPFNAPKECGMGNKRPPLRLIVVERNATSCEIDKMVRSLSRRRFVMRAGVLRGMGLT